MSLATHRKQNFQANLHTDQDGETRLVVTHNGHQFNSISLNYREMALVKELLSKELEAHAKEESN